MEVHASTCLNVKRLVISCSSRGEPATCANTHEAQQDAAGQCPEIKAAGADHGGDLQQKPQKKSADHVVVVVEKNNLDESNDHKKISHAECRICQEEEKEVAKLDIPCACTGSLMYAHQKCVQRWCDEKGDTICEICQQPYKSGYTSSLQVKNFSNEMEYASMDVHDDEAQAQGDDEEESRSLVLMATRHEHPFLDAQNEEANFSKATCCRSATLILMALFLLHHAIAIANTSTRQEDASTSTLFSLFLLRVIGFLLPCYIMVHAVNLLQKHHQREESSMHTMHEVAIILQAGALQAQGNMRQYASSHDHIYSATIR